MAKPATESSAKLETLENPEEGADQNLRIPADERGLQICEELQIHPQRDPATLQDLGVQGHFQMGRRVPVQTLSGVPSEGALQIADQDRGPVPRTPIPTDQAEAARECFRALESSSQGPSAPG